MTPPPPTFAALLRSHRENRGISQALLAGVCGLSKDYISNLERGVQVATNMTAARLAKALGADVGAFIRAAGKSWISRERRRIRQEELRIEAAATEAK